MKPGNNKTIGRMELEVLRYVAENHPIRAKNVAEYMAEVSGQARTTVLTVLERLRKKGFLTRRKIDGVNQYSPRIAKSAIVEGVVSDFVDDVLQGSVSPFVAYLTQTAKLTSSEINDLRNLIAKLDNQDLRRNSR